LACGTLPTGGTSYEYNGEGLRMSATTATSTTDSAWDTVSGGNTPLNINDATTTSSGTTDTSYIYGNLLFGGTAPIEQITTTSSGALISYLVSNQTGVQGVYSDNAGSYGTVQEMAIYSVYGAPTISSGTNVTPFGFQGSYTDATGEIYLIHRYYDPATGQFLSIDPDVAETGQPYVFTNDDPLNAEDPLGDCWGWCTFTDAAHAVTKAVSSAGDLVYKYRVTIILGVVTVAAVAATGGIGIALVGEEAVALGTLSASADAATIAESSGSFDDLLGATVEKLSALGEVGTTTIKLVGVVAVPIVSLIATIHEAIVTSKPAAKPKPKPKTK
jgi:RHS repeat-associated protein